MSLSLFAISPVSDLFAPRVRVAFSLYEASASHPTQSREEFSHTGDGDLVVPCKRNECTLWLYRSMHNQDIRSQRVVNEWGIRFIHNQFHLFLGRWLFEPQLFPIVYHTSAMVSYWQFNGRGYALQTRGRYQGNIEQSNIFLTEFVNVFLLYSSRARSGEHDFRSRVNGRRPTLRTGIDQKLRQPDETDAERCRPVRDVVLLRQ